RPSATVTARARAASPELATGLDYRRRSSGVSTRGRRALRRSAPRGAARTPPEPVRAPGAVRSRRGRTAGQWVVKVPVIVVAPGPGRSPTMLIEMLLVAGTQKVDARPTVAGVPVTIGWAATMPFSWMVRQALPPPLLPLGPKQPENPEIPLAGGVPPPGGEVPHPCVMLAGPAVGGVVVLPRTTVILPHGAPVGP